MVGAHTHTYTQNHPEPCSRFGQSKVSQHLPHFLFFIMHNELIKKNEIFSPRAQYFLLSGLQGDVTAVRVKGAGRWLD